MILLKLASIVTIIMFLFLLLSYVISVFCQCPPENCHRPLNNAEWFRKMKQDKRKADIRLSECVSCGVSLGSQDVSGGLAWYTVVIQWKTWRACNSCFHKSEYLQRKWMG